MSTSGRWFISPHAVRRAIERINPRWNYEQARDWLIDASKTARYLKPRQTGGGALWRADRRHRKVRFVVMDEPGQTLPVLRTVLPTFDGCAPRRAS